MGSIITDRLELIIDALTGGAVTEIKKVSAASADQAVAQERAALASANVTKAMDSQILAQAKLSLAQAKEAGDAGAIATAQDAVSVATKKAAVSKAEAAVASNDLSVANLRATASTAELGTASEASGGLMASLGAKGGGALATLTAGMAKFAPLVALVLGGKLLLDGIKNFTELGDTIRSFQLVTGASATEASQLVGQLKALGIDPDVAAKAMARLGAAIGDGTTKIGQYGIQIAHNADGTTNLAATFENLRKAYNDSTDAATKDAIAKQIGLRGAAQLAPLLALNTQQIRDLNAATSARGEIFSQNDINNAHNLTISENELKLAFQGLELSLAKGVVPALTTVANAASHLIDMGTRLANSGFVHWVEKIGGLATGITPLLGAIHLLTGATNDSTESAQQRAAAAQAETDSESKLTTALLGEYDAQKSVRDAAQSLTDAQFGVIDAQHSLNDLLAKGAVDQTAVAAASKSLASASEEVTKAEQSEADAQDTLNKAREKASALDIAEAQNKIALAGDKIGEANAKVTQAKEAYDALLGSGSASAGELAAAAAAVKTAQDDATQAVLDQQQATVDLQKVKQKGTEQDPAVVSAERSVRDAHQSVADAIANRADAEQKLRDAEKPDPNFAEEVAKATNDVARAHLAVQDAQERQVTAALDLKTKTDALMGSFAGEAYAASIVRAELEGLNNEGINPNSLLSLLDAASPSTATNPAGEDLGARLSNDLNNLLIRSGLPPLPPARADGGPVSAYGDYVVGERGPEILRMGSRPGTVLPSGGGTFTQNLTMQVVGGTAVTQLAQEVARESSRSFRTSVLPRINGRQ